MTSTETFSKLQPKSPRLSPGIGGAPEITWEDVILAIRGLPAKHYGFINYVYVGDETGRSDFFAGLYCEASSRDDIKQWWEFMGKPKHAIEKMVLLAMHEWKTGARARFNGNNRAHYLRISRDIWQRQYSVIYDKIVGIPVYWEDEAVRLARRRLRK